MPIYLEIFFVIYACVVTLVFGGLCVSAFKRHLRLNELLKRCDALRATAKRHEENGDPHAAMACLRLAKDMLDSWA